MKLEAKNENEENDDEVEMNETTQIKVVEFKSK